jgi:hypothetical protein
MHKPKYKININKEETDYGQSGAVDARYCYDIDCIVGEEKLNFVILTNAYITKQ